jgi:hypothetical protein
MLDVGLLGEAPRVGWMLDVETFLYVKVWMPTESVSTGWLETQNAGAGL